VTLIKICGITNLDDARAAVAAGADMLGFNFYRPSPRYIEPHDARTIIETLRSEIKDSSRKVTMVGVFVNESSPDALRDIADAAGIDAVQLHGDESAKFCRRLRELLNGRLLIKVLRAGCDDLSQATEYDVDAIMLDAFHSELRGGTGRVIDWGIAVRLRDLAPRVFLAGGLSSENVAQAIAEVQPWAVDACSALESSPRKKDAERMHAFVQAARKG
jgi:phosphoribosylanthranilate isomerase